MIEPAPGIPALVLLAAALGRSRARAGGAAAPESAPAGPAIRPHRQIVHGRRGQPAGGGGGPGHAARGRHCGRCRHRGPAGSQPGRAAVLGAGRRRLRAALGRGQEALKSYDGRETAPAAATPDRFMREDGPLPFATRSPAGSASACRARCACWRPCTRAWPAAVGQPVRAGNPARRRRLSRVAAPASAAQPVGRGDLRAARAAHFFDTTGSARPAGLSAEQSRVRGHAARHRRGRPDAFYSGPIAEAIVAAVRRRRTPAT